MLENVSFNTKCYFVETFCEERIITLSEKFIFKVSHFEMNTQQAAEQCGLQSESIDVQNLKVNEKVIFKINTSKNNLNTKRTSRQTSQIFFMKYDKWLKGEI